MFAQYPFRFLLYVSIYFIGLTDEYPQFELQRCRNGTQPVAFAPVVSAYAQTAPESDEQVTRLSRAIDADRAERTPAEKKISEGLLLAIRVLHGKRADEVVPGAPEVQAPPLKTLDNGRISV